MGLIGAIFLAKGVLALSPKAMLELTPPHARIGYAPEQIAALAAQKADTIIGVLYIVAAFLIQVVSLVFFSNSRFIIKSSWMGFWIVVLMVGALTVISSLAGSKIRNWYRIEMGKLEVEWHCRDYYSRNDFSERLIREVETMSRELLDLQRGENESNGDFMKRVFEFVECPILDQVDFSRYDSGQGEKK